MKDNPRMTALVGALAATVVTLTGLVTAVADRGEHTAHPAATRHTVDAPLASTSPAHRLTGPRATFWDASGDVAKAKLDLQKVSVVNTSTRLTVRVYFPGVARTFDFPLGYVAVFLDVDRDRRGPEYEHFMQFWSDYRFSPTRRWRAQPSAEWSHSPEGRCVADAGLSSDRLSRLRWFQFTVRKTDGCFEAGAVRVAVTTANEGRDPRHAYGRTYYDHLRRRHSWSAWVPTQ